MRRNEARELLMQLLFMMEARAEFTPEIRDLMFNEYAEGSEQLAYMKLVSDAFLAHKDEIDELIEAASDKWHINRMAKVDLAVLRLAVCEMKFSDSEIPVEVAINEAVNLAKKYGDDNSGKFVNGVLGKVSRQ
ncbi:MAG: transcription antitermination factor NusB [Firmicutes bacterium]|nr:transcription antitermination factor NusB [Bacillota bacterium]MBR5926131.1 transcription antitermination factor NusB [Bacillota bacterium]MBR6025455.1 transcription antitermination factor NusB [Bacillota bacterium]